MGLDPNGLQIGQTVTVQEMSYGVQIKLPEEGEAGLTVIEVGREHLVLDDAAGGVRKSIPLYLIHEDGIAEVRGHQGSAHSKICSTY
jgi:hypothetical protein